MLRTENRFNEIVISGISCNTKIVKAGNLFVCLPGYNLQSGENRTDTHMFANEAIEKGAVAIVAERLIKLNKKVPLYIVENSWKALSAISDRFYNHPSQHLKVIGVTGRWMGRVFY